MEQEEKIKKEAKETGTGTSQQESPQIANASQEPPAEKPSKKTTYCKRAIVFLILAAAVGVSALLIAKHFRNDDRYVYEYEEEPEEGYVVYKNGKSNIVNPNTQEVIVKDIDWCYYSESNEEPPLVLFAKNGKRGFCNIATNKVIVEPTTYTKAWIFSEGMAAVEKDGFIGFVNTNGEVVIGFRFPYRGNSLYEFVFHDGHCIVADSSNKIGVIDKKGRWIIKPLYDNVELAKDYAIVYTDGEFKKQIDFEGNVLQEGIIDDIYELHYDVEYTDLQTGEPKEGYAKINDFYEYRVGRYSGLINSKGVIITPPIYTDISGITPTLFTARLKDWTSIVIIDQHGKVVSTVAK